MYPQYNIDRINQQIQELERIKSGYQNIPQPINIYNNANGSQTDFKAQYLNENQKVDEILVNSKTAFIDLNNGKLHIKELNGEIASYDLILPKTKEQLRIEELERKVKEYEDRYEHSNANNEEWKSATNDNEPNESTTKTSSRSISRKSE